MDKNKFTNYKNLSTHPNLSVFSITEDHNGNIWFSSDEGVFKFDGKIFTNFNFKKGFRELISNSIKYDGNGNIVCVHEHGLDILNLQTNIIHYYNFKNPYEEINPDLNSITADSKGNIWIGTEKGILIFNSHFKDFSKGTLPVIKKATLLTENKSFKNNSVLKYNQNNISIDFTGIWYSDPDLLKYQYKLEGYDKNWITTRDRRIIFPDLAPGKYIFNLKSTACNNFVNPTIATISFTISKPFWNQSWFTITIVLLLALIAYLILKFRENNIRKFHSLEKEKIKFQFETLKSQVNPHFLFNSFNTLIAIIEKDKNIAVEYVENLSDYFRNLINYRDKDLITLEEELKLSSAYYFLQQKRFGKNLEVKINFVTTGHIWLLPPLVVQILIENAIKHNAISIETPIIVSIYIEKNKLVVKNNINPKFSTEKSTGTGIKNINNRYALLTKEKVEVIQTETDFMVKIPLIEKYEL